MDAEKARQQLQKNAISILLQFFCKKKTGSNIPQNSSCTVTNLPSVKQPKLDEQDMQDTAEEARTLL